MAENLKNCKITTWGAVDATIGAAGLVAISLTGSAAVSTLTLLDGTAIKMVIPVASTQAFTFISAGYPIAFSNLIVDATGTGSFSIIYTPRP